jgi:DNA-binding transcriptional ArsR family regulator
MADKITTLKLEKPIEEFISQGITSSTVISDELKKLGYNISQPTVSRYLKRLQAARKEETKSIMEDHINKQLPADLTALETMEAKCLEWAQESNEKFAHRLAEEHILATAEEWFELITTLATAEQKEKNKALKTIMSQCFRWMADDLKLQTARLAAMGRASSIIDMKLRYALGEGHDGKIIFVDSARGETLVNNNGRFMVIPGGNENHG